MIAPLYVIQCGIVVYLLWRYRSLLPELNIRFHWMAVPMGLGLTVAWIAMGWWMAGEWTLRWEALCNGPPLALIDYGKLDLKPHDLAESNSHYFADLLKDAPQIAWIVLGLRVAGMSMVVPLFEELFVRSAVLRGMSSARQTGIGILQVIHDLPLVGDLLVHTNWGRRIGTMSPAFTKQLEETPVGIVTVFGIGASTFLFMLSHGLRDYPGTIACGLVWCGLLWWTNRPAAKHKLGLGPVVWSHGITNAALWAYSVWSGDWQFL